MATDALSPEDARRLITREESAWVLDVRAASAFADGHLPASTNGEDPDGELAGTGSRNGRRIIVVCESGERSAELAAKLRQEGHDAASVEGGMRAWRRGRRFRQPAGDPQPAT
jgi:rhodanese-related sulfurtransferase